MISQHLKQLHIICPDQPSLLKEIQNAFKDMSEKPEVIVLSAFQIIDYRKFYDPVLDETLAYYQEPHQFHFKA